MRANKGHSTGIEDLLLLSPHRESVTSEEIFGFTGSKVEQRGFAEAVFGSIKVNPEVNLDEDTTAMLLKSFKSVAAS